MDDGRYEKILKVVLDDRTLTDAECRLVCYLAARPPSWTIYPALLQKDLKRSLRHWVLPTLKLLHARGWVTKSGGRIPGQANSVLTYRLNRDAIVQRCDLGSADSDITPDLGSAGSVVTDPVMTDSAGLKERTDRKRELKSVRPPASAGDVTRLDVKRLCTQLADRIEANGSKRPAITKTWLDAARLLLDSDKRTEAQVSKAIDWCQNDEFWRRNIMSMPTLRKQYDRMRLQAQAEQRSAAAPKPGEDGWVQPVSPFRGMS